MAFSNSKSKSAQTDLETYLCDPIFGRSMNHIIRQLPDAIANQIAAGEVVQRPASAVKELLENAVDAGASEVILQVKEGGKTFIQVVDNGRGMSEIDARMCFERHATSKIATFDDMLKLRTFGFRGEALASIAAVAQVELKTRQAESETGTFIRIDGSEFKGQEAIAADVGSTFTIKNLYYNVPARRNFLKSNQVELSHISEEFNRVALAHPEVGFSFYQAGALIQKLAPGKLAQRIAALFGESYREKILAVQEEVDFLKVWGYISKPELAKKSRGEQYFFANQRFIKNGYLHHAVMTAFEGMLPAATFPFYALFLELDPDKIDINVHPTKTEIKFENERLVYSVIQAAVRKALQQNLMVPRLDFEPPVSWLEAVVSRPGSESTATYSQRSVGFSGFQIPAPSNQEKQNQANWEKLYTPSTPSQQELLNRFEKQGQPTPLQKPETEPIAESTRQGLLNLHGQYLLAQVKSGMMLIHLQRAWERIHYERFLDQVANGNGASQQLLFPQTITLSPADMAVIEELGLEIRALGMDWEPFGGNSLLIRGVPPEMERQDPIRIIEQFLEQYKWNQTNLQIPKNQSVARALAKRNAQQQAFHHWQEPELKNLINQLFACQVPHYSPDQQPITRVVHLEEIEKLLGGS
jgi:DNA mismatch repair protein MutL